jgi:hypothetical protein
MKIRWFKVYTQEAIETLDFFLACLVSVISCNANTRLFGMTRANNLKQLDRLNKDIKENSVEHRFHARLGSQNCLSSRQQLDIRQED